MRTRRLFASAATAATLSTNPMRVAIIGGGFGGLATSFRLAETLGRRAKIQLFDPRSVGEAGASAASGGVVHPLSPRGSFLWGGVEGFSEALRVFDSVEKIMGIKETHSFVRKGVSIVRPHLTVEDKKIWEVAAERLPEWIRPMTSSEFADLTQIDMPPHYIGASEMRGCAQLEPVSYMQALWGATQALAGEAIWHTEIAPPIETLRKDFDAIVIAGGAGIPSIVAETSKEHVKAKYVRGDMFIASCPNHSTEDAASLQVALSVGEYVIPQKNLNRDGKRYLMFGATHTHFRPTHEQMRTALFTSGKYLVSSENLISDELGSGRGEYGGELGNESEFAAAESFLRMRLRKFLPSLDQCKSESVRVGVRLVTVRTEQGRLPFAGLWKTPSSLESEASVWLLGGFGSRGLLYHALAARHVSDAIVSGDDSFIPLAFQPSRHLETI